ncbi:MAG: hypothetical protein ACP5N0_12510 [Methanosarcina sp.]|uniref:hypothetical protein n=1 Tax=Methanosarcina sp. TaxID=2213 RepID=UPI003BB51E1C
MNMKEAFDQSDIDKIVAAAESDTIESKVATLEEEVNEIKGSIKTLLMDIRETMSVLENPFQNIQGIANIAGAIINPKPAEECKIEDKLPKEEVKESKRDDIDLGVIEPLPKRSFEDLKEAAKKLPDIPDSKLIDPMSFYKTIVWSKDMVEKYDYETIKELVEIFYLLGYIKGDMKEIVLKLTELLDKSNDLDNAVMDLYRLYHILHPEDFTLDSRMLDFVMKEGGPRGPVTENRKHKTDS